MIKEQELHRQIIQCLEMVKDPEIPVLSVVDLGIIRDVKIENENSVRVFMTPTFVGCPAIHIMIQDIQKAIQDMGIVEVEVIVDYETPWSSDLISPKGREALKNFGLAPPPIEKTSPDMQTLSNIECPQCGSAKTILRTPFGSTLCRSIHYCENCKQGFEQFKPV